MASFLLSAFLASLLLVSSCDAWGRGWRFGGNAGAGIGFQISGPEGIEGEDGEVGDPCEPAVARPCGQKTLVSGPEVEQLGEEEFGPNVCRYTFTLEVAKFKFELKRSSRCLLRFGAISTNECPLLCGCTGECSDETMTIEKAVIDCCDGFTTPRPTPMELANGGVHSLFKRFRFRITSGGCPIRVCPNEEGTDMPTDEPTTGLPTEEPTTDMPTTMPITEETVVLPTDEIEG